MNNTNWDTFKVRCSNIHRVMAHKQGFAPLTEIQEKKVLELEQKDKIKGLTDIQRAELNNYYAKRELSKKIVLSDTCIEYLMEVYAWETQGMISVLREMSEITQMEKGKYAEEDCITLLSIVEGQIYSKNDERVSNDFLSGEPDVFSGAEIMAADEITDIKAAFDYPGFLKKINQGLPEGWEDQVKGYCDITGAKKGRITHCLVTTPPVVQENLFKQLRNKMLNSGDYISADSPQFAKDIERIWNGLQRSMVFDHIPHHRRVFSIKVEPFTEFERNKLYDRVKVCREWLWNFHDMYQNLNKSLEVGNESVTFESN